jgi:hypothetical protein
MPTQPALSRLFQLFSKTAVVTLTVQDFQDIFTAGGTGKARATGFKMKMKEPHPQVWVAGGAIHVRPPGAKIRFEIGPGNFIPIGIAYMRLLGRSSGSADGKLGLLNFAPPEILPKAGTISIITQFKPPEQRVVYEFYVTVQQSPSGRLGIIDPPIVHEPH